MKLYWVYIMASHRRILYIGFTGHLQQRVHEHKCDVDPESFCARYRAHNLVYFEEYTSPLSGIDREKQLKAWSRAKKNRLDYGGEPYLARLEPGLGQKDQAVVSEGNRGAEMSFATDPSLRSG
jgi:putative endonuclease